MQMKMWRESAKQHPSQTSRPNAIYNRILAIFLTLALVGSSMGAVASAADEVVTDVYITASTGSSDSGTIYVEGDPIILNAYATIVGNTSEKLVTADAAWSSTSTSVKVDKGVVTATAPIASATITVRYKDKTDSYLVKAEYVYDELKLMLADSNVPAEKEATLGADLSFKVMGIKGSSTGIDETAKAAWTSSNTSVATVDKGVVKLLSEGKTKITVKYKGKSQSVELDVKSPYKEIHVKSTAGETSPIELILDTRDNVELVASAELQSGTTPESITNVVEWTSSNAAVAKVDDKGKVTAVGKGTAVITAKRFGHSDSITIIVRTAYEALKVTPDKAIYMTLQQVSGIELTATAASGTVEAVNVTNLAEWKISDEGQAVAVIDLTKVSGRTFVVPKGAGTTQISVSYKGLTKTISVNVSPTIESIDISKDALDVFVDDTGSLPAVTGTMLAGDTKDVSNYVEWVSSDTEGKVITIEDGKWKAVGQGTAVLTAKVNGVAGRTLEKTVSVTVHNKILALLPDQDAISVVIGKEVDLPKISLIYENGDEMSSEEIADKIVWKSSTPNLLVKKESMKGLLAANATLTGTYLNKTVKIKVTVEEEFTSFEITPNKVSVTLNKSKSIKVVGTTKSGKKVTLSSRVSWSPSNKEHVSIKGSSMKGLTEGSGKLTATVQGKTLEVPYEVTAKLTKLSASDTSFKAATVGSQLNVQLTALYETGKTENVTSKATWTSSKASVATVSDGKISVKGKGTASIKGSFGGKTVSIKVTVK